MIKIATVSDPETFVEFQAWCKDNCVGSWAVYDDFVGYYGRKWTIFLHHSDDVVLAMLKFSEMVSFRDL